MHGTDSVYAEYLIGVGNEDNFFNIIFAFNMRIRRMKEKREERAMLIIAFIVGGNTGKIDREMMAKDIERLCVKVDRWKKKALEAMEDNTNG